VVVDEGAALIGIELAWQAAAAESLLEGGVASRAVSWGRDQDGSWGLEAWRRDGP
jgi:hypothetical protein